MSHQRKFDKTGQVQLKKNLTNIYTNNEKRLEANHKTIDL